MTQNSEYHSRIRYWILKILAPEYPNPVDFVMIRSLLSTFGLQVSDRSLCAYLSYLQEKGFASIDEKEAYDLRMATITADGLNVLDGRIDDAGVSRV